MDFDDHRDFMDQDDPAGQFPTVNPGPIHQFLSGIPDWLNFNPEDLDWALESLSIPLKGPSPPGISLQDAIEVKQWHNIHIGHHKTRILQIYRYTILYIDIVHCIGQGAHTLLLRGGRRGFDPRQPRRTKRAFFPPLAI